MHSLGIAKVNSIGGNALRIMALEARAAIEQLQASSSANAHALHRVHAGYQPGPQQVAQMLNDHCTTLQSALVVLDALPAPATGTTSTWHVGV